MDNREVGLSVIKNRIINDKDTLNVKSIWRNSNEPIDKSMLNAVYIFEGEDSIIKHANNNFLGYPARRLLEVEIELVTTIDRDGKGIKTFYQNLRRAVLCDKIDDIYTPNPILADDVIIRELRTYGAHPYSTPGLIGMKMVLGLQYIDNFIS